MRTKKHGTFATRTLISLMGTRTANHKKPIDPAKARREALFAMASRAGLEVRP